MSVQQVDILGFLKATKPRGGSGRARMTIEFRAPDIKFRPDEKRIAEIVARAITTQIRQNFKAGRAPDGSPLPSAKASTVKRRAYRLQQSLRGGELHPSIRDPGKRASGKRNWRRRFHAAKMGDWSPRSLSKHFGVESGLLGQSAQAVPMGRGWRVFFATIRAEMDDSHTSAIQRVFRPKGKIAPWSQAGMKQPMVQGALQDVVSRQVWAGAKRLLSEATKTLGVLRGLGAELDVG